MAFYNELSEQVLREVYGATLRTWGNGGGEWTYPDGKKEHRSPGGPAVRIEEALALLCRVREGRQFWIGVKPDDRAVYFCEITGARDDGRGEGATIAEAICLAALDVTRRNAP